MTDEQKLLPEKNWSVNVEFPCGCSATMEERADVKVWVIDNFCNEHDPTIYPNETNNFDEDDEVSKAEAENNKVTGDLRDSSEYEE